MAMVPAGRMDSISAPGMAAGGQRGASAGENSCTKMSSRRESIATSNGSGDMGCAAATISSVVNPISGFPAASASARALDRPMRSPVKLPGPTVVAIRSSAANACPACPVGRNYCTGEEI